MPEFNHHQDDTQGTFAFVLAFIGLILFIGAIAAMVWIFS